MFLNTYIAKKSLSVQVGASKNTPIFTFAISSSLIIIVEGVKYGLSLFTSLLKPSGADYGSFPKFFSTASTNL